METLIHLRPRSDSLFVSGGRSVLITGLNGFIDPTHAHGLMVHQTRVLSCYRYLIDGEEFQPVTLANLEQHSWLGYYIQLPPEKRNAKLKSSQHTIELCSRREVGDGMRDDVRLTNFNQRKSSFELQIQIDADFADQQELSGDRKQKGKLKRMWRKGSDGKWSLGFDYLARHRYKHQDDSGESKLHRGLTVAVPNSDSEPRCERLRTIKFKVELAPHASWRLTLDFTPFVEARDLPEQYRHSPISGTRGDFTNLRERFIDRSASLEVAADTTLGPLVSATLARSKSDLAALRLYDLDHEADAWTLAAGLPIYIALFGRDTLIASWEAALLSSQMLRGTLAELAKWQAVKQDNWRDAEAKRMLHEAHTGPVSVLNFVPQKRYYGTITTNSFFSVALAKLWRWTGERELVQPHLKTSLSALEWYDRHARSSAGFYQYQTRSNQGVKNQGFKDSSDAIVHADGSQVSDPIAITDVQGYVYAARCQLSQLLWNLGKKQEAKELHDSAVEFRKRFNDCYWMEDEGAFAMGLDSSGRQIMSVASNTGHTLGTGIANRDYGIRTAARIFESDMFSGWGVRTLSADHPAFNPYSYHRGTVWPVEQGEFATGLWRYGRFDDLNRLCRAQFELAALFDSLRLPELVSGHPRDEDHPFPALYPDANSPQAWSASATYAMIEAMIGFFPMMPFKQLLLDPHLPPWLPEFTLRNVNLGSATISLKFCREPDGSSGFEVIEMQGEVRVRRYPDPWSIADLYGDEVENRLNDR
ncbi:MAG: glycogen debranching N-terminal domain-containing protein [Candidatus Binataceae bacterium]